MRWLALQSPAARLSKRPERAQLAVVAMSVLEERWAELQGTLVGRAGLPELQVAAWVNATLELGQPARTVV